MRYLLNWRIYRARLLPLLIVFLGYLGTAELARLTYSELSSPAILFSAVGISFAAVILAGLEMWPAIFLAALVNAFSNQNNLVVGITIAIASTLQALLFGYLIRRLRFDPLFSRMRDTITFIFVVVVSTLLVPTLGILAYVAVGLPQYPPWGAWWLSGLLSALTLTPLLVRWIPKPIFKRTRRELLEAALALTSLVVVSVLLFFTPYTIIGGISLVYVLLIPLFWIAIRVGPRIMTLALFVLTTFSLTGTILGATPLGAAGDLATRLFQIEVLDVILAIIFLVLCSSEEGRKEAINAFAEHATELEHALDKIRKEDQAKTEFLAVLAHELRNPLAPVLSSIELLKLQGVSAAEMPRLLDGMEDRVRTMARLLDDLLDISRITRKKFKLQKESVETNTIIKRSIQSVEAMIAARGHRLKVTLPDTEVWMQADAIRLEQIIVNLLTNAAKYTESGGEITLLSEITHRGQLVISVKDTGIGIPEHMRSRIFEPFVQVERPGQQSQGLGIGLSITRKLVEMHGGEIEARGRSGAKGSEFILTLPLQENVQLPLLAEKKKRRTLTSMPGVFKILVVDDNEAAADSLAKLLKLRGHAVDVTYNGADTVKKMSHENFEIVLLDIGLPDTDGYAVARELRDLGTKAFIIALTGYGLEEDKQKARTAGFDHHLTKPVGLDDIEHVFTKVRVKPIGLQ